MNRLLPFLLLALLTVGCTKNEIKLSFELGPDVNTPCRVLYYASGKNGGMIRETVAEISGGKGDLALPVRYPTIIYLFSPSQNIPGALIYGERGDKFTVSGSDGDVASWDIKGNKVTEALSEWRLNHSDLLKSANEVQLNKAVAEFVAENADSPAAAIILYYYFHRRGNEKEFNALVAKLSDSIKEDTGLMSALSTADFIGNPSDSYSYPRQIVRHGKDGYADTLNLFDGKKTFMIFRGSKEGEGIIPMDSVKNLIKRDSGKGIIAEFYMESDSMAWQRYLRKDTVKSMSRLWMPLGTLDSAASLMGVRRVPYYIVTDGKGKELYRGDDWQNARKKFIAP